MNCEKCQELLSDFLDGVLSDEDHRTFSAHLEECLSCYHTHREMDEIISYCRDHRGEYDAPPNERALWLRIRNTIESQQLSRVNPLAAASDARAGRGHAFGWFSGLLNRHLELSLPQMAAAVIAIAIGVALLTAIGMRSMHTSAPTENVATAIEPQRNSYPGSIDDRMQQQMQVIDYWNKRVETRKALWNAQTRGAFERNLQVINQAVATYREELRQNPHDEVSAEMLNEAMNDKMDLLREFSDL